MSTDSKPEYEDGWRINRRDVLQLLAVSPLALALSRDSEAEGLVDARSSRRFEPVEARAGKWLPWVIPSPAALRPNRPSGPTSRRTQAELRELLAFQRLRTPESRAIVQLWDANGGLGVWTQILLDKIKAARTNPVRAARAIALLHTAMADATIAVWNAKFVYRRLAPFRASRRVRSLSVVNGQLPSYPSEHAAIAAAASAVLGYLYPSERVIVGGREMTPDAAANEAASSRLWAGANYRSDLDAGLLLGQAVGQRVAERGMTDGSTAVWDAVNQPGRIRGPGRWEPTPPASVFPPLEPLAGYWNPWLLDSGEQFRASIPPALQAEFPSPQFLAEAAEVKATVDNLTADQKAIALFWADNPGESFTPPGHWTQVASTAVAARKLSTPRAARAMAHLGVGLADAAIACWDAKYAYWVMRPITAIRTLESQPFHDPNFNTFVATPPFPSYTSGHSTFSGFASMWLEYLFPGGVTTDALGNQVAYAAAAAQAALSRLYGGIHFRSDNDRGLECGRQVAALAIARAKRDGAAGWGRR